MRLALSDAELRPDEIAAVMATANGSPHFDRLEAVAISEVFGNRSMAVASVKGAIGEFGAAGAATLVASLLSMSGGFVLPTAGFTESDPECAVGVSSSARPAPGDTFLVNGVASGGTNYSIVVKAARGRAWRPGAGA